MHTGHGLGQDADMIRRGGRQVRGAVWPADVGTRGHLVHHLQQAVDALARPRRATRHGDAEPSREGVEIDMDMVALGLVEQIDAKHSAVGDL